MSVESNGADAFITDALRSLRSYADWWYWITLALAVPTIPVFFVRRCRRRLERLLVGLTATLLTLIGLELYGYTRFHVPACRSRPCLRR